MAFDFVNKTIIPQSKTYKSKILSATQHSSYGHPSPTHTTHTPFPHTPHAPPTCTHTTNHTHTHTSRNCRDARDRLSNSSLTLCGTTPPPSGIGVVSRDPTTSTERACCVCVWVAVVHYARSPSFWNWLCN